jgi:hypothetical protein
VFPHPETIGGICSLMSILLEFWSARSHSRLFDNQSSQTIFSRLAQLVVWRA